MKTVIIAILIILQCLVTTCLAVILIAILALGRNSVGPQLIDLPTQTDELPATIEGVTIHYQYNREQIFPEAWLEAPINCKGSQVEMTEAGRVVPLIEKFISAYDTSTIMENLTDIYLLGKLQCYGKEYGGTNSTTGLYVKVDTRQQGFSDQFILMTLHSEFSSIFMRNYLFPSKEWIAINDQDFTYTENAVEVLEQPGLFEQTEELLEGGFLTRYATTSLENDFNVLSEWFFVRPEELCQLQAEYERIAQKTALATEFYTSIDATIEAPLCK